jgi:hypothetical protein
MNLETLVERACLESGYNDTDDVAAAEKFARHWDEHIWNYALWKDALVVCDVAVTPATNDDHAEGVVFLPEVIDRVVAARSTTQQIVVRGQEHYYRMDFDSFAATGTPIEFNILPPAWFTWRWSDAVSYMTVSGAGGDAAAAIKIVWLDGAGKRTVTQTTVGAAAQLEPASEDSVTVLAVYKVATTAAVTVVEQTAYIAANGTIYDSFVLFSGLTIGKDYILIPGGSESGQNAIINGVTTLMTTGVPIPFTAEQDSITVYGFYDQTVSASLSTDPVTYTLSTTDTRSPSYQRLRLLPIPTAAFTLKVLGKAKYEPLDFDQQEPALRNCTNALLAFIRGSLKRRGGENAAAQMEFQEANALLKQVEQIEALQAANNSRFMPEDGYAPEHGIGPN